MIIDITGKIKSTYQFFAGISSDDMPAGTSKIMDIPENDVLAYGKLRSLFGEPAFESDDLEYQYEYNILAKNEAGMEVFLYAYSGPSGPSIGGFGDEASLEAASQLVEIIKNAVPVDYEYKGYYMDFFLEIHAGIKNGVPFYEEKSIDPEKL